MNIPVEIDLECSKCGKKLNEDNYHGWFDIKISSLGFEIQEPICDECIKSDDGSDSEGAY